MLIVNFTVRPMFVVRRSSTSRVHITTLLVSSLFAQHWTPDEWKHWAHSCHRWLYIVALVQDSRASTFTLARPPLAACCRIWGSCNAEDLVIVCRNEVTSAGIHRRSTHSSSATLIPLGESAK